MSSNGQDARLITEKRWVQLPPCVPSLCVHLVMQTVCLTVEVGSIPVTGANFMKTVYIHFEDCLQSKTIKDVVSTEFVDEFYRLLIISGTVVYIKRALINTISEQEAEPDE